MRARGAVLSPRKRIVKLLGRLVGIQGNDGLHSMLRDGRVVWGHAAVLSNHAATGVVNLQHRGVSLF